MAGVGRGPAAVLLLAVACALLVRRGAPPDGGERRVAPEPSCRASAAQKAAARARVPPTPNSTTAAPHAIHAAGVDAFTGPALPLAALRGEPTQDGLYIVRFRQYKMAADHLAALRDALGGGEGREGEGGWRWVERRNKAAAFPTDFGLLRLAAPGGALKARLERLPFVKGVHPERRLTRSLMTAGQPGAEHGAAGGSAPLATQFAPCAGAGVECVAKRPGRLQTRPTFSLEDNLVAGDEQLAGGAPARVGNDTFGAGGAARRRLLQQGTLASILGADAVWAQGFRGQGVRMGVFDTGIKGDHPDVKNIVERSNWTHEPTLDDGLGHGSFVAGVIAGTDPACPGLAPEVSLHTFRVFTNDQVSYTSWFLDAFNYAIATRMHVVNLSIGGPDYLDEPFVEKVAEVTSAGIVMVSAIGNDGPLYGTLNNPADQNDVIGIGGIDYQDAIAPFSSRGMSTWEPPLGYGRSKPDVMAYGRDVQGSRIGGGCRSLSGTSVASPVVAGAVCLLASVVPEEKRWQLVNPASMKQALVEGAVRLPGLNLYEQGAGKLSVPSAKAVLETYEPRASLVPAALNFTDCPYMWPFCRQPVYAGAMPLMFNATILNGLGLTGRLRGPPSWTPADAGGRLLDVRFEWSEQLWPWSGYLALFIRVADAGAQFAGTASGEVAFVVESPPARGEAAPRTSAVRVPLVVEVAPTPPRQKRLLWDQFHSVRYPPAYFPRDDLQVRHDILDWHGDHPHTNFHEMYDALRDAGFFLEVLGSPATCFDASQYAALLAVDGEDEWHPEEVAKLAADVETRGLGLLVFADWYHLDSIRRLRFYDDNTRSWWEAATGGANVPAINDMLVPYGAAFEAGALEVEVEVKGLGPGWHMASGVPVKALPAGAWLHRAKAKPNEGEAPGAGAPVLALLQHGAGRVGLYGDSNCLDSSHSRSKCFALLTRMAAWAGGEAAPELTPPEARLADHYGTFEGLPQRRDDYNFTEASPVLRNAIRCYPNSPLAFHGASFAQWRVPVSRPVRQPVSVQQQQPGDGTAAGVNGTGGGPGGLAANSAVLSAQEQQEQAALTANSVATGAGPQQQPASGNATGGADTGAQQQPGGGGTQPGGGAGPGGHATVPADVRAQEEQATAALLKKAKEQEALQIQKQQGELLKRKERKEGAEGAKEGAGGGAAAAGGDATAGGTAAEGDDGREHPDIDGLAQFGEGQPQHVDEVKRDPVPADQPGGGGGAAAATGGGADAATGGAATGGAATGGAAGVDATRAGDGGEQGEGTARITSLIHQKAAEDAAAALAGGEKRPRRRSLLPAANVVLLLFVVAIALWSARARRRRSAAPLRLQSRKWLLPMAAAGGARDRHE